MFEFFFKYPFAAFAKGEVVFLGRWPVWLLVIGIAIGAAVLAWPILRRRKSYANAVKPAVIWSLQAALIALLLVMLWQPALSVTSLRPQQNIVAVVVDDSRSMALVEDGRTRLEQAVQRLNSGVLNELGKKFQLRLYRTGEKLERIEKLDSLRPTSNSTRLGEAMKLVVGEASTLPVGAVVLLTDGADNSGGIDLTTISEIRRHRIPVHTVGFGREKLDRDIEIVDAQLPTRVLADARLSATVGLRQFGYSSRSARISIKEGEKVVASREVTLKGDGMEQAEAIVFNAGKAGSKSYHISVDPLDGEENRGNNAITRGMTVDAGKPRVLYIEGEPKWEYKFIRRAIELDEGLHLVSMLRTTQNKIYRQGIAEPTELEQGFPARVDELFGYQAVIIGGVEANYFTPTQQELLRQFVDRRGGGLLFLGGRDALADGGWAQSQLADLLPVTLPNRKDTFRRELAKSELTSAGRDHLLTRIDDNPDRNVDRWKKLPDLMNYQDAGTPKPGAVVLAELLPGGSRNRLPLLVTQNYGRGRTGVFATAGSWRWQMQQPLEDMSHEIFWQQLLRWAVSGTAGRVISSSPKGIFSDDPAVPLRAEVRDRNYLPMTDAQVEAHVMGPEGISENVSMRPDPANPGQYTADWAAVPAGAYVVEIVVTRGDEEVGRDTMTFRRENGLAENFRVQQNRELLEKLSAQTGGRYYRPDELRKLTADIDYSEAGISVRETRDLWNMPLLFLLALALRSSEWMLRRKWGVV